MEALVEFHDFDEERLVCGQHDRHARTLRNLFGVTFVSREGHLKIIGDDDAVKSVKGIVHRILEIHRRGETISEEKIAQFIEDHHQQDRQNAPQTGGEGLNWNLPPHVRPKSDGQARYLKSIVKNAITFGIGPAGTGKTYLAVAMAISDLKAGLYRKLVLARPAVEAGEKLGFLPGDFQAKVNPYLRPLYDAIESFLDQGRVKKYLEGDVIEIVPLAYMRGRTLDKAFIILDEAQNTTPKQMKMFLTRMGGGSKIVITGDITQIDLPGAMVSGMIEALGILKGIKGIGMVAMNEKDIVRHPLVQKIVNAYDRVEG
ncbi:MAG: PhoH family protein [Planctomycetes bacterium]|nr:PhoH family protein [Planctomycetota bacterium]